MKILIVQGSPHKQGSSNLLAESFIQGAKESGHEIEIFDAAHSNLHPCLGCDVCGMVGPCCQKDDMVKAREMVLHSDMIVFVSPLYYFGFSAQLKMFIDRFYSFNGQLSIKHIKSACIVAAWNSDDWTMKDIKQHYETLCRYLEFQNQGMILATGCGTPYMTKHSDFIQKAYSFGKSL